MDWEGSCDVAGVPREDLLGLFARRPARWFHTFLVLAANQAAVAAPSGERRKAERHWYRLDVPDDQGRSRLVWHPTPRRTGLFSGFSGQLVVGGNGTDGRLTIVGEATDGDPAVNEAALRTLLELLGAACDGISRSDS
jgi:hypothetical protein